MASDSDARGSDGGAKSAAGSRGERAPDAICEGGDLDCGSGLLLIIREAMAPLPPRGLLEVRSRETSVKEDLPAWCRLVGHELAEVVAREGGSTAYRIVKGGAADRATSAEAPLAADLEQARRFTWSARVRWTAGMQATSYVRNHAVAVGQPASFDTADPAPSAIELLLSALGGCLAVGLQWRASREGIAVRQLEVSLKARSTDILLFLGLAEASRAATGAATDGGHPGLAAIEGSLYADCDCDEETLQALFADTVARSPVAQTLLRGVPLQVSAKLA